MTDKYISKQDAVDAAKHAWAKGIEPSQYIESLEPADVVWVVRCKDCKYNATTHKCLNPDSFFLIPKDDDFCSYGERKDRGHEKIYC